MHPLLYNTVHSLVCRLINLAWRIPPHPSRAPMTGTTTSPAAAVRRTFFGTEKSLFKNPGGSADIPIPPTPPPPLPSPAPPETSSGIITSPSARSSGLCEQEQQSIMKHKRALPS